MSWLGLEGRTVVITGAGGGIGQALARSFAAEGARAILLDRDLDRSGPLAEQLGGGALALACDLADPGSVAAAAGRVEAEGGADVLVNSAAILRPGALESVSPEDWSAMLAVNLTGYLTAAQAFGRGMLGRGRGALVHVASIAASQPQPASGAYSASKAAVAMLSRQLAAEWGPRGLRSNCVSPGLVLTPMSAAFYADPEVKARREAMVPLRRIASPQDMADAVLYLASDRAAYVTGQDIVVDGGLSQSLMGLVPRPGYA
ncbi:SDR family NAD(P)-dependent oxidoreductase [Paracoccus sp. P2]|uniref:SDR family NAD(P)-dependent oxidoreductase n=1 Tax=Paracoccus TaxID=265 RepID=UPI00048C3EAB|nr:SDR family oxidoreductase [Paracoccus pantotrophus]MDF3855597.1 SDR family NAD(P)-dependent oxidoreductase [Paracoccus pantotrophus]RDD96243.1 SDR family NAD(P)-dependent oxidoreductase [Paracoccus pantotrophus]RNI17554.1 SDR family oxidoreductase [Paracoccus pantotrophus]WGR67042.1 SDR family oxidoreductase [Paracoccus pantotrophus]SFO70975.1 NAD(P)-dependent dehydrogenase, short-chain alcohol dehydrogenase family [Paracoccus pantotrophus]